MQMTEQRPTSAWANSRAKRALDVALVVGTSPLWVPLTVVVGAAVWIAHGRPVLFRQVRPGRNGEPFVMLKFRTMTDARDENGALLPDQERLTPFGRFLRRSSLDELPELLNVLRGDMSLVGPRPLLERYVPYYTSRERRRLDVRPGITGWAQIHGRNESRWADRLEHDVVYVESATLRLDVRILLATVFQVFRATGVHVAPATRMQDLDVERAQGAGGV